MRSTCSDGPPLDLIVEEMLDYIEQAMSYTQDMTFDQYSSDAKTQRAVERCIEVISEASRHVPEEIKGKYRGRAAQGRRTCLAGAFFK